MGDEGRERERDIDLQEVEGGMYRERGESVRNPAL